MRSGRRLGGPGRGTSGRLAGGAPPLARSNLHPGSDSSDKPVDQTHLSGNVALVLQDSRESAGLPRRGLEARRAPSTNESPVCGQAGSYGAATETRIVITAWFAGADYSAARRNWPLSVPCGGYRGGPAPPHRAGSHPQPAPPYPEELRTMQQQPEYCAQVSHTCKTRHARGTVRRRCG